MASKAIEGIARKQRPTRKDAERAYRVPAVPLRGNKARGRPNCAKTTLGPRHSPPPPGRNAWAYTGSMLTPRPCALWV